MSQSINLKDGNTKEVFTALNMKDIMGGDCNMYVTENQDEDKAVLSIYGGIELPNNYYHIFVALEELSKKYPILEININTPGGAMITLLELLDKIELFEYVVTVGRGEVCSAGFLLWMKGNTRVACPYTTFMIHRESGGSGGIKTPEALDMYINVDKSYSKMYEEFLTDLKLSELDLEKIKMSEVWYTAEDLIDNEICISKAEFNKLPNPVSVDNILTIGGKSYRFETMFQKWVEVKVELVKYPNPKKSESEDVEDVEDYDESAELINVVDTLTSEIYKKIEVADEEYDEGDDCENECEGLKDDGSTEITVSEEESGKIEMSEKDDQSNEDGNIETVIKIDLDEVVQGELFPELLDVKELGTDVLEKTKELGTDALEKTKKFVSDFMKKD